MSYASYTLNAAQGRSDPQAAQGALTRAQWRLFQQKGRPLEDEALRRLTDTQLPNRNANEAGALAARAFTDSTGMTDRRLSRFGVQPTADQQTVLNRRRGLSHALAVAGAENDARRETEETQLSSLGDALQIGRGVSGQASEGLGAAAGMAHARDQQHRSAMASYDAQKRQHRANTVGTVMSGLGLAAALFSI